MRRLPYVLLLALMVSACGSSGSNGHTAAASTTTAGAAAGTTTRPTEPAPLAVLQAENDALNRGDVAGSIAYFAPNAVLITPLGRCNPCVGRDAIRDHWSSAAASQTQITLVDPHTIGDIVTVRSTVRSPQFPAGIKRAIGSAAVSVRHGKITRIDQRYDKSDPQTAALLAIVAEVASRPTTT